MKKILALALSIILLYTAITLPANAVSVNYCERFEWAMFFIKDCCESEDQQFSSVDIFWYTFSRTKNDYITKTELNEDGEGNEWYSIPATVFESTAKKHFNIYNIEYLRDFSYGYYEEYGAILRGFFDGDKQTYEINALYAYASGGGQGEVRRIYGYKLVNDKYEVYFSAYWEDGPTVSSTYYYKATLLYDGTDIKYLTFAKTDDVPQKSELITPDTPVESEASSSQEITSTSSEPISSSPSSQVSTSQEAKPQSSSSKPQSSSSEISSAVSSKPVATPSSSSHVSVSSRENAPSKINTSSQINNSSKISSAVSSKAEILVTSSLQSESSSSQASTSQVVSDAVSVQTTSEQTSSISVTEEEEETDGSAISSEESSVSNTTNTNPDSNNAILYIIIAIAVIVLLGGLAAVYFLVLRKKK